MTWEDDPEAPPSDEELRAASALREALDARRDGPREAELARSLRAAHAPTELDRAAHERILAAALPPQRSNVLRVAFGGGVAAVLAAAAAALVLVRDVSKTEAPSATAALVQRRSAQDLFDDPFPREGGGSARVDRIATARGRDLRANQFAKWGVR